MAVRFDAATDQIGRSTAPAINGGWTFLCWVYLSVDRNDFSTVMRIRAAGATRGNLATGSSGETLAYFTTDGSIISGTTMTPGNWYRAAITIPATGGSTATGTLYTATESGATSVQTGTVTATADPDAFALGGRGGGDTGEWFNGRIAYARMWTAQLSQSEVEAEWASTTPVRTSGLWGDWPLTVHTDLNDASGNGRHLTAGSTATATEDGPPIGGGADATLTPGVIAVTAAVPAPAVAAGATLTPGVIAVTAAVPAPAVAAGATLTPAVVAGAAVVPAPDVSNGQTAEPVAEQGSWWSYLAIIREAASYAREDATAIPSACPDCGEPLRSGPRGELHCRFDGYIWGR